MRKVLSAIVMLLIFIPIFLIGGTLYDVFIYVLGVIGLNEFLSIKKVNFFIRLLCFIVFTFLIVSSYGSLMLDYRVLSSLLVLLLPTMVFKDYSINDAFYLIGGVVLLSIGFSSIMFFKGYISLYLFLIGIISDICACVFGKLFGKRRLAYLISPCKTIEGMLFGVSFGTLIPSLFYFYFIDISNCFYVIFLSLFLSIMGVLGDLCFSCIKRYFGIKDFSNLIPGHGGILDRFDSILFIFLGYIIGGLL